MRNLPADLSHVKLFPVKAGDKIPALSWGWQHRATNDPVELDKWDAMMPRLNWGIVCGSSGLFVIDIDPAGFAFWAELQERIPGLEAAVAASFTVRTPRGGFHHYFRGYSWS